MSQATSIPPAVQQVWRQQELAYLIRASVPGKLDNFKAPFLEDLVNCPPFSSFGDWMEMKGSDRHAPFQVGAKRPKLKGSGFTGQQEHAMLHRHSAPQAVDTQLTKDDHFNASIKFGQRGIFPLDDDQNLDPD